MDLEQVLEQAICEGMREGVKTRLGQYGSPLEKVLTDVFAAEHQQFRAIFHTAIKSAVEDESFRNEIIKAIHVKLAKILISSFGGELEKHVNALKSDPATRARITLAIEEIVKERSPSV